MRGQTAAEDESDVTMFTCDLSCGGVAEWFKVLVLRYQLF